MLFGAGVRFCAMADTPGGGGSAQPKASSPLFQNDLARSNLLMARTLYNEMIRNGRSRGDILDFVNCLLSLVAAPHRKNEGPELVLIDPATGLPTAEALNQLVLHHLEPEEGQKEKPAGLMFVRIDARLQTVLAAQRLRHIMRSTDVVAVLGDDLIGVVVYPRQLADLDAVESRALRQLKSLEGETTRAAIIPLTAGMGIKQVWRSLLTRLKPAGAKKGK